MTDFIEDVLLSLGKTLNKLITAQEMTVMAIQDMNKSIQQLKMEKLCHNHQKPEKVTGTLSADVSST